MKRLNISYTTFFLLVLILFISLIDGCGRKKEDRVIRIGVTDVNAEGRFQSYIEEGMKKYQETLGDKVEVVYLDAKEDVDRQTEQVKYFIKKGMDAVVVMPVSTSVTGTREMTKLAGDAKIPIVYVNKYPDEFDEASIPKHAYYIGSPEKSAGIMQMEYLAEKLNGKGNIGILMGDLTSSRATFERTEGVEEVASRYPDIKIKDKRAANWLMPMAASVVEDWLATGWNIDAIVANNDEMAIGAIRALEKYGLEGEVMVVGIDATNEAIDELEAGKLTATVFQDAHSQGKGALEIAIKAVEGEQVPNITWIPFKLVTPENYKEVIDRN